MANWNGKSGYPPEQERERQRMIREADIDWMYRKRLQAIRDKDNLFGEDSLDPEEKKLKEKHHSWFYPEEG